MCGRRTGTNEQAAQKLTGNQDRQDAEKGGGCVVAEREQANKRHRSSREDRTDKTQRKEEERHKKSGEQAAKNMSEAVHERTCVVAQREAGRPKEVPGVT